MHEHATYPGDLLASLRSFVVLASELAVPQKGAYERAARRLAIDASVLRRRMRTLEDWVGVALFAGRGGRLVHTPDGHRVHEHAKRILAAVGDLARSPDAPQQLRIGCTGTIATELLPDVLLDLEKRHPRALATIRRLGSAACRRAIDDGELDIAVIRAPEGPPSLASWRLCDDRLWLAVPAAHPLRSGRVTPKRLAAQQLVLYGESSQTRVRVMSVLEPLGARVRVEVDGKRAALEYVARGLGISFLSLLPRHPVERRGVELRDVTTLFPPTSFWVVRPTGRATAVTETAIERIRARARGR